MCKENYATILQAKKENFYLTKYFIIDLLNVINLWISDYILLKSLFIMIVQFFL